MLQHIAKSPAVFQCTVEDLVLQKLSFEPIWHFNIKQRKKISSNEFFPQIDTTYTYLEEHLKHGHYT